MGTALKLTPELLKAFGEMCRRNGWTTQEVLECLIEEAVADDYLLAVNVHRNRIRKKQGKRWERPTTQE
jgi:predicted DNA-binding protein